MLTSWLDVKHDVSSSRIGDSLTHGEAVDVGKHYVEEYDVGP